MGTIWKARPYPWKRLTEKQNGRNVTETPEETWRYSPRLCVSARENSVPFPNNGESCLEFTLQRAYQCRNTQSGPGLLEFITLCQEATSLDIQFGRDSQIYRPGVGRDPEAAGGRWS